MRVYLAAFYDMQEQMRAVREELLEAGHTVTSRWIDQPVARATPEDIARDPGIYSGYAQLDIDDVNSADLLACFCSPKFPSVGRHIEFGLAYAWGMQCVVVGVRETPFHVLNDVMHFPTTRAFLAHMRGIQ